MLIARDFGGRLNLTTGYGVGITANLQKTRYIYTQYILNITRFYGHSLLYFPSVSMSIIYRYCIYFFKNQIKTSISQNNYELNLFELPRKLCISSACDVLWIWRRREDDVPRKWHREPQHKAREPRGPETVQLEFPLKKWTNVGTAKIRLLFEILLFYTDCWS